MLDLELLVKGPTASEGWLLPEHSAQFSNYLWTLFCYYTGGKMVMLALHILC